MSATVRKFIPRSPRYVLQDSDPKTIRFAQKGETGTIFFSQFVDISLSGLAFVTDRETAPLLYEMIKIEIPLTAEERIAWWARVVRIEEFAEHRWFMSKQKLLDENKVLVAVQYHDLPQGHLVKIKKTLDEKFIELERKKWAEKLKDLTSLWAHFSWQVIFYVGLVAMTLGLLWFLSRPSENYDAQKGAPWGQRFEGFWGSGQSPKEEFPPENN